MTGGGQCFVRLSRRRSSARAVLGSSSRLTRHSRVLRNYRYAGCSEKQRPGLYPGAFGSNLPPSGDTKNVPRHYQTVPWGRGRGGGHPGLRGATGKCHLPVDLHDFLSNHSTYLACPSPGPPWNPGNTGVGPPRATCNKSSRVRGQQGDATSC